MNLRLIDWYEENSYKTDFMGFNQDGAISSLNGKRLKLEDRFIYLGGNISSTESDINTCIRKAWTAIETVITKWKSDPSDKIKREFFQGVVVWVLLYDCTSWTLMKRLEKNVKWELHKDAAYCFTQIVKAVLYKTPAVQPLISYLIKYPSKRI